MQLNYTAILVAAHIFESPERIAVVLKATEPSLKRDLESEAVECAGMVALFLQPRMSI